MLQEALAGVEHEVMIGSPKSLSQHQDDVLMGFVTNLNANYDELLGNATTKPEAILDFETLSLVQEEELDGIVALEGMVNAARNDHLPNFISFNTRLNALFPQKRIDESSNPLDPIQIANSFQEALGPLRLDAQDALTVYRAFNKVVLKHLDEVLHEANQILIDHGVIPDLGMEGQKKGRAPARNESRRDATSSFGTINEENFEADEEQPELFSIMQNLMHTDEASGPGSGQAAPGTAGAPPPGTQPAQQMPGQQQYMVPAGMVAAAKAGATEESGSVMQPFQPAAGQQVQMIDQAQLMEVLSSIQKSLDANVDHENAPIPSNADEVQRLNISESLGEMLSANQETGVVSAVDTQSSDIINLVALLYEAIWNDESVPIPIKELIGRTQITIIKVALSDTDFFNREDHPARAILNEFAAAGIGWTEVEKLEDDPLYQKIQDLVSKIMLSYDGQVAFFEELIADFRSFLAGEAARSRKLEQSILKAKERQDRLADIEELVTQKIDERILGRDLDPFVADVLENQYHKFMVMLVLKEGPGSNAWKQAINTIDVLLWSVQPHDQQGDRDRLETINPRLLNNVRKALRIASLKTEEIDPLIARLKEIQEVSFPSEPEEPDETVHAEPEGILPLEDAQELALSAQPEQASGAEDRDEPLANAVEAPASATPPADEAAAELAEPDYTEFLAQVDGQSCPT